jgi:hypothetical protein
MIGGTYDILQRTDDDTREPLSPGLPEPLRMLTIKLLEDRHLKSSWRL